CQDPRYAGLVVTGNMLMVVDGIVHKVALHNSHDGKLLATSDKLQSGPQDLCVVKGTDILVMVALDNGKIEILSVELNAESAALKRVRTLDVTKGFDQCDGVRSLKQSGKLVVSGVKRYMDTREQWICWGIVSHIDGHVIETHKICKGDGLSYLATSLDDAKIYISCFSSENSPNNGVYAFSVKDGRRRFFYQHSGLKCPQGICVERRGYIYVCNWSDPPCIYQLTEGGELVTVHREGIPQLPLAIFWEAQQEQLFVTGHISQKVRRFRLLYSDQVLPTKVLNMDARSLHLYKMALKDGKEKAYNIRVMVVGQYGVGKTTLIKRLLGKDVNTSKRQSTEGIHVHIDCCKVSLATREWTTQEENAEKYSKLQRLVKFLNNHVPKQGASAKQEGRFEMDECDGGYNADRMVDQLAHTNVSIVRSNLQGSSLQTQSPSKVATSLSKLELDRNEMMKDAVTEIFQLVNEHAGKLEKSVVEYATLAMWDFAGQYVFYTTHQAFLTSRAVYLLVINLNQQVTDLVKDDCFLDVEGIKPRKVHDLVEIWLNSIHYCAQSTDSGITPVILVGTHVDKIPEKSRQNVIDEYYNTICQILKDKPSMIHLMGFVAIDNTKSDPKLEELKRNIFELASQQPHWGAEKPARWLPLEQAIMTLKASGVMVAPLSLIQEINSMGSVRIESSDELNEFLKFQHEMGTILYFSVDGLREKIVLSPQWLIDALNSLITTEFIGSNTAITRKWHEFKEKGKLTQELIDAVWTKEKNPEFYDNKEHIILVMEKLNIITRTRSFSKDGKEVEMDDYFLAPCMLRQEMPKEVISPQPSHQMERSSVLCYVFIEKFLPPPIFHRLIAACLDCWPIAKERSEHLIYCGCCVFEIDPSHKLTLYTRHHVIFARVARVDKRMPSSKLCISVREFIEEILSKIINYLCHNLAFECCLKCPESREDCPEGIIPVSKLNVPKLKCPFHGRHQIQSRDLKKFWFQAEDSQGKANEKECSVSSLPLTLQDKKPSERELGRLSMKIGKECVVLGLELGITWVDIQQIQMDYRYTATQCLMFLYRWTTKCGDRATFRNLEKACRSAEICVDIPKSINITGNRATWPPQEKLDKQPEDHHLHRICQRMGKEYVHLGVELGVPVSRIEQIQMEHPHDVQRQCFKILTEWSKYQARQATFKCLEDAFRCIGIDHSILDTCMK
ncbi:hypothetical protein ACJMK2_008462, partial [Sinanodonta woodiana]